MVCTRNEENQIQECLEKIKVCNPDEIILVDGVVHDFESNLVRRLAGLLYISDVSCGNAKNKALGKINIMKNSK